MQRLLQDVIVLVKETGDFIREESLKFDHSKIEYMSFQKNLYRVPRSLAGLTNDDVISRRANLKVRVRGHGA